MTSLEDYTQLIDHLINQQRKSYNDVAAYLQTNFGVKTSERSVRRFCSANQIRRNRIDDESLGTCLHQAIQQVGPTFGRRMMTGFVRSQGIAVGERRVGRMLREIHQPYHVARSEGARNLNPIPYYAEYFGHKLHIDQNEKLVMFGVTHVVAIDGFSKKIVAYSVMPIKNNLRIYTDIFRSVLTKYGIWDQIRVDHGKEFHLTLFMQQKCAMSRRNQNRLPYVQSPSTQNHVVERVWPEVNNRLNYPIKCALMELVHNDSLNMEDNIIKYCVSLFTIEICCLGMERIVSTWNAHRIPGRGIPETLAVNNMCAPINHIDLPEASDAANIYAADTNGHLTAISEFAADPFPNNIVKTQCIDDFTKTIPDVNYLLDCALNLNFAPFQNAVLLFIEKTRLFIGPF